MASTLEDRLLVITRELQRHLVPHAFGGAIALAFYSEPRATADLDINIFLHPREKESALALIFLIIASDDRDDDRDEVAKTIDRVGQARLRWGTTPVDLFFSNTPFHDSCASRIGWVDYLTDRIPILSAEDLAIFKISYDRPQDWLDLGKMFTFRGTAIDKDYIRRWVFDMFGRDDRRIAKLEALAARS